jgi:hypothetical protein
MASADGFTSSIQDRIAQLRQVANIAEPDRIHIVKFSISFCSWPSTLKTVRESLILTQGGAEIKSYTAIIQTVDLLFIPPAYGSLAARVRRVHLINRSYSSVS